MRATRFLQACRRQPVDTTPVWLMRQAGRYLPEYRELRSRHPFLEVCKTPELAAQATLQPVDRLGVDAAILFSDILIAVEAMGAPLEFHELQGPVLGKPLRDASDVAALKVFDPLSGTPFVTEAVRILRRELAGKVPLIGFSGLPFTLATYLVEGGKSRDFAKVKAMMRGAPKVWDALMGKLAGVVTDYAAAQAEAGAQALQLFDTWAGILEPKDYERCVLPYTLAVARGLRKAGVPLIHYCGDCRALLALLASLPVEVLSIDWRIGLDEAAAVVGQGFVLQGNLDPETLLQPVEVIEKSVAGVLRRAQDAGGHIFNLGHGILPKTDPDSAAAMVEAVHRLGRRP